MTDLGDGRAPTRLTLLGVVGMGEIHPGQDLASALVTAVDACGEQLRDGDVLAVSSKVVSKAEGAVHPAADREMLIADQTVRVVAERRGPRGDTRVVRSRSGPVLAAAGVDASNTATGTVLALPADPDGSARALRRDLMAATGRVVGVILTDTAGRPWRQGQTDLAIGAAGVRVVDDLRGTVDHGGQALEVTVRAVADEIAAAADLVKGKATGIPAALLRGLAHLVVTDDGDHAAPASASGEDALSLVRDGTGDWFRCGHVEAVRSAMAAGPGDTASPGPAALAPGSIGERLRTAVTLALAAPDPLTGRPVDLGDSGEPPDHTRHTRHTDHTDHTEVDGRRGRADGVRVGVHAIDAASRGALAQRLRAALWAGDLSADLTLVGDVLEVTHVTDVTDRRSTVD